jgi:hypothetical protein
VKRQALITLACVAAAFTLTLTAFLVQPEARRPEIFSDQGEPLFPEFRDVLAAKAIEVVEYNGDEAVARPLKAELRNGKWILPSHYDYPAEAKDRIAKTAAALLDLRKDIAVSDRVEDHGKYGVVDPLDAKVSSLSGRGKRVTLRDGTGAVLADIILGDAVKERPGYRYVRVPAQKRVYAVKTAADPSARFEDWVDPSILRISAAQIRAITVLNYSMSETGGQMVAPQRIILTRQGEHWTLDGATPKSGTTQALVSTLANLKIVGVRPKPPDLARQLREQGDMQMTLEAVMSLRQRGFIITPEGRLLASEGETQAETGNGIVYNLRFGEAASQTEGKPQAADPAKAAGLDRFLFVSVSYDAARAAKYGSEGGNGAQLASSLRSRFSEWYYIISGADFNKLRPKREALVP